MLLFDASGRFLRSLVGSGEGPTELTYLRELHHCSPGMPLAGDARRRLPATLDSAGYEIRDLGEFPGVEWGDYRLPTGTCGVTSPTTRAAPSRARSASLRE